jgi:hypothetical protein
MATRTLLWICVITAAVPLGATTAHLLELPNKLGLDGPLWLAVQQNVYRGWGPFIAPFEIAAIVSAWALAYLLRRWRAAFPWVLAAALCLSAMLVEFFLIVEPVNVAFARWTPATLPPDWAEYRLRWEVGHAIGFILALVAFCALLRTAFIAACADALQRRSVERPAALVDEA